MQLVAYTLRVQYTKFRFSTCNSTCFWFNSLSPGLCSRRTVPRKLNARWWADRRSSTRGCSSEASPLAFARAPSSSCAFVRVLHNSETIVGFNHSNQIVRFGSNHSASLVLVYCVAGQTARRQATCWYSRSHSAHRLRWTRSSGSTRLPTCPHCAPSSTSSSRTWSASARTSSAWRARPTSRPRTRWRAWTSSPLA